MNLKDWYTAQELADMKLPDLPTSDRRMREKVERENWPSRKRTGKGGGMEYQPPKTVMRKIEMFISNRIAEQFVNGERDASGNSYIGLDEVTEFELLPRQGNVAQNFTGGKRSVTSVYAGNGVVNAGVGSRKSLKDGRHQANKPAQKYGVGSDFEREDLLDERGVDSGACLARLVDSATSKAITQKEKSTNLKSSHPLVATGKSDAERRENKTASGELVQSGVNSRLVGTSSKERIIHRARANIEIFINSFNGSIDEAIAFLNKGYAEGTLESAQQWAYEHAWQKRREDTVLTRSTYGKWVDVKKAKGSFAPAKREKDFSVKRWHGLAIQLRQRPQGSNKRWIHEQVLKMWKGELGEPPSYWQIDRFFRDKFSQMDQLKGRYTGSKLRSHQFYQHRTSQGLAPADEVHGDGWNTHFNAPHPVTGEFVTYEIWHFHDVATRYVTRPAISLTENSEVIAKAVENVVRELGVPLHLQTDSTKVVKGNDKFTKALQSLEERVGFVWAHPETVGNSQANGIAENFNISYLDPKAKELATYQNPKMMDDLTFKRVKKITADMVKARNKGDFDLSEQKRIEAQRMGKGLVFESYEQAVAWIYEIFEEYNDRPHRSLKKVRDEATGKMRHQTPREALNEHRANGWEPVLLDEQELIDAFRPHVLVKVVRETVSPYGGMRYRHEAITHWIGKQVIVAYDIEDYKRVWVKDLDGALICEAEFVGAASYRTPSAQEYAAEKRLKAQLRRLDNKRNTLIERAPNGLVIEGEKDELEKFVIPAEMRPQKEELSVVPFIKREPEKELSYMETLAMLRREDDNKNELAAGS